VGRIHNTRKLLTTAALIMSGFLITSSFATTVLIPHQQFEEGGQASGRALAYLAHEYLGNGFGTAYDLSTIGILWFAGASAMAGLLNIVPRYLPRYGMAPEWTRAVRPLALAFTAIAFAITVLFRADVEAQAGAYATGVLVLMLSAAVAVTLSVRRGGRRSAVLAFGLITLVFAYTTIANIIERPDGVKIASFFIAAIIATSLISRVTRATELRVTRVELDETARSFIEEAAARREIRIIPNEPHARDVVEYAGKVHEERKRHLIPPNDPVLFLEVTVVDPSEFESQLQVTGEERYGYRILRVKPCGVGSACTSKRRSMVPSPGIVVSGKRNTQVIRRASSIPRPATLWSSTWPVSLSMAVKILPTRTEPPTRKAVFPPRGSRTTAGWPSQVPSMVIQLTLPGGTAAAPAGDDSASTSAASKTATIDNRRITMSMTSPWVEGSWLRSDAPCQPSHRASCIDHLPCGEHLHNNGWAARLRAG
jgi:hypothetical protein